MFPADVLIEDERIVSVADWGALNGGDEAIDATGAVVMPGAIDSHAHFEDPGHTERGGTSRPGHPPVTTAQLGRVSTSRVIERAMSCTSGRSRVRTSRPSAHGPSNIRATKRKLTFGSGSM
jgi:imidazolonepropionase-like amidohydrolase